MVMAMETTLMVTKEITSGMITHNGMTLMKMGMEITLMEIIQTTVDLLRDIVSMIEMVAQILIGMDIATQILHSLHIQLELLMHSSMIGRNGMIPMVTIMEIIQTNV